MVEASPAGDQVCSVHSTQQPCLATVFPLGRRIGPVSSVPVPAPLAAPAPCIQEFTLTQIVDSGPQGLVLRTGAIPGQGVGRGLGQGTEGQAGGDGSGNVRR